ncbi:hypothetical protein [Bacillus thuringiensis]|uniref:hypothetical protein n=1 Tax=Bacillus thuringiensis TaxID=1428 RepID=UPI00124E9CCA|nr:hypothetical protein [Bacillus thuringiensis]KAB2364265.1 hypothetical protein F8517_25530 [Bacillus thuringiensis]
MINYIKSEFYRFQRSKLFFATTGISLSLVILASIALFYSLKADETFKYANLEFYFANIISFYIVIIFLAYAISSILAGKDLTIIRQSISFGISRKTIFFGKLIVSLSSFLILGITLVISSMIIGNLLLEHHINSIFSDYLLALTNMLPLIVSSFILAYIIHILAIKDIANIAILILIYSISGDIMKFISKSLPFISDSYKYFPSSILSTNFTNFASNKGVFLIEAWVVGILLSIIYLIIGVFLFSKKDL